MQRMPRMLLLPLLALAASLIYFSSSAQEKASKPDFDMTASYIEACSCDMFCPCDLNTGKDSWLVVNFDPSVGKEQQAALGDILGQLYPIPWQKKAVDTAAFSWNVDTKTGVAHAKMDNGKSEVTLERVSGNDPHHEVVVHNLKYWGAQSNDGFRMWKSKHEAFEGDGHKFSYDGTNGFLITIRFSGNAKPASAD